MVMESSRKLHALTIQNPHDFDWPCYEDLFPSDKALELPSLDCFFDFNSLPLPFHCDHLSQFELQNLENLGVEIFSADEAMPPLYDDVVVDEKPQRIPFDKYEEDKVCGGSSVKSELQEMTEVIERGFSSWNEEDEERKRFSNGRRKSSVLELDEIQKHFNVPILEAAKELKVGLTVLKKRCRELNIMRWPHRKLKSLKSLIDNVKEMGLTNEIMVLEEHKKLLEKVPDMDLTERTKRLRQACFKANYKKRRSMAPLH